MLLQGGGFGEAACPGRGWVLSWARWWTCGALVKMDEEEATLPLWTWAGHKPLASDESSANLPGGHLHLTLPRLFLEDHEFSSGPAENPVL